MGSALWTIAANPRKRARRKGRSAAQRAATARMLAANRARRGGSTRKRSRRRSTAATAVTVVRRARRTSRRIARRVSRSPSLRGIGGGAMGLVKAGAIGAGGALVVDVAQGFVNGFLPASLATKLNPDGSTNYMNYAVKGALAVALAHFGGKLVSRETAHRMAAGSMVVMAYELLRPLAASMLPASMPLGWYSPGMTFKAGSTPGVGVGKYQSLGVYQNAQRAPVTPIRSPNAASR